jgi:hypothetical protein
MRIFLSVTLGLCLLFNLVFHGKADSYKRKAEDDPRLRDHFDFQRILWERTLAGSVAIAFYSFVILALFP